MSRSRLSFAIRSGLEDGLRYLNYQFSLFVWVLLFFAIISILLIAGAGFFIFQASHRDTRVTLQNDTGHDVRLRMLQSESGIPSPFLSRSWVMRANTTARNYTGEGCLFIEDEEGRVLRTIALSIPAEELLQLPPDTQRVIALSDPGPYCRFGKEIAKTCYLGKEGMVPVEACP